MQFGKLLKEYIKKQDITIYQLAKDSKIDRSFLQGVLNSTRKLPLKRFSDIVNTDYFTEQQVHNLCENYFTERFGNEKLKRFEYLEKALTGKIKEELESQCTAEIIELKKETSFYSGKKEVSNVINTVLNSGKIKNFISNFDFDNEIVNKIVYNCCKQNKISNFFHFVNFDKQSSVKNLQIIFNSIHYAQLGYITYSYKKYTADSLMPYFIIADNHFLVFDETGENCFIINAELMAAFLSEKISKIKKGCQPVVIVSENAFEYMNLATTLSVGSSSKYVAGIDNQMCPTFITPQIMETIATPMVKNIPSIFSQLSAHYELNNSQHAGQALVSSLTITYDVLDNFVKNGILECFPRILADPVPKEMRSHFLKELINEENIEKLIVTDPHMVRFSYDFAYQINSTSLIFSASKGLTEPTDFNGSIVYYSDAESVVEDFKDYLDFFSASEKSFSQKDSKKIVETFIKRAESQ